MHSSNISHHNRIRSMSKVIIVLIIAALGTIGLLVYRNMNKQDQSAVTPTPTSSSSPSQATTEPSVALSPIFSYLSKWVPNAIWEAPKKATNETPYGKATGMEAAGKITGKGTFKGRNFEDAKVMSSLGFPAEDINFAADGPGASNWGYSKTENGQTQVAVFSYSSNRLLGPESTSPPYTNLSVFVSDPFTKK